MISNRHIRNAVRGPHRHRHSKCRAYTLVEVMIASSLSVLILGGMMSAILMVKNGVTSGQSQLWLHNDARYGTQHITRLIQEARIVASRDNGTEIYIINPDDTASLVYFEDADDDPDTVSDNVIWYDPDTEVDNDEEAMVRYVSPIDEEPLFANIRGGVSLTYHVGDPGNGESIDRKSVV